MSDWAWVMTVFGILMGLLALACRFLPTDGEISDFFDEGHNQ